MEQESLKIISVDEFVKTLIYMAELVNPSITSIEHNFKVAELAVKIGKELDLDKKELLDLEIAAKLHNLGKIKIPKTILYKSDQLLPSELERIQEYPEISAQIIKEIFSEIVYTAIRYHKESWNGTGYPEKIAGEQIPLLARIINLAESFYSLQAHRVLRRIAKTETQTMEIIRAESGTKFDPTLVQILVKLMEKEE